MLADATRKLSASLKRIELSKVIHNGNSDNIKIKSIKRCKFETATPPKRRTRPPNAERYLH
jgi:hypothetical protein